MGQAMVASMHTSQPDDPELRQALGESEVYCRLEAADREEAEESMAANLKTICLGHGITAKSNIVCSA